MAEDRVAEAGTQTQRSGQRSRRWRSQMPDEIENRQRGKSFFKAGILRAARPVLVATRRAVEAAGSSRYTSIPWVYTVGKTPISSPRRKARASSIMRRMSYCGRKPSSSRGFERSNS